jgi:CHAT domain-containing protein/Tfp pilus assembly protein PilF
MREIFNQAARVSKRTLSPLLCITCVLLAGSSALADEGASFIRALKVSHISRAERIFLANQNEACKAFERFLVTQSGSTEICRNAVRALQPRLKNQSLHRIEAEDPDALALVYSHKEQGWRDLSTGNLAAAQKHFREALEAAQSYALRWQQHHLLFLIGYTLVDQARLQEARKYLLRSWELRTPGKPTHLDGMIQENLGAVAQKQGLFYQALKHYQAALELHSAIGYSEGVATEANNLAELHKECGNLQAALTFYRRCLATLPKHHVNFPIVQNNVAECLLMLNRAGEAGELLDRRLPAGSNAYFQRLTLRQHYFRALHQDRQAAHLSQIALRQALLVNNPEFVSDAVCDRLMSLDSASEASNLLRQLESRLPAGDPGRWRMQHLLARIQLAEGNYPAAAISARNAFNLLAGESSIADFEFNFTSRLLEVARLWTVSLIRQNRWHSALLVWEMARSHTRRDKQVDIAALQQTLGPSCAVIDFCFTREQLMAWIIRRNRIDFVPLSCPPEKCLPLIDTLLGSMVATSNLLAPNYNRHASRQLFDILIRPLERHLDNTDCWTLLPDGQLHAIPFEILESGGGQALLDRASIRYWSTLRFPPGTEDSLKTFTAWMEESNSDRSFLPADTKIARNWEEARTMNRDTLHYAGHSLLNQTFPALSMLAGGEPVTARQIAHTSLSYRLVVLSSCESAGEVSGYGNGLLGLSAAFQTAGARQIIATLWPIDQHSSLILADFYRLPLVESELAANFRRARLKFRAKSYPVQTHVVSMASPYFWGPYVLIAPHYAHASQMHRMAGDFLSLIVPLAIVSGRLAYTRRRRRKAEERARGAGE